MFKQFRYVKKQGFPKKSFNSKNFRTSSPQAKKIHDLLVQKLKAQQAHEQRVQQAQIQNQLLEQERQVPDFRFEIERRYQKSTANKVYEFQFGQGQHNSDTDSSMEIYENVHIFELQQQNEIRRQRQIIKSKKKIHDRKKAMEKKRYSSNPKSLSRISKLQKKREKPQEIIRVFKKDRIQEQKSGRSQDSSSRIKRNRMSSRVQQQQSSTRPDSAAHVRQTPTYQKLMSLLQKNIKSKKQQASPQKSLNNFIIKKKKKMHVQRPQTQIRYMNSSTRNTSNKGAFKSPKTRHQYKHIRKQFKNWQHSMDKSNGSKDYENSNDRSNKSRRKVSQQTKKPKKRFKIQTTVTIRKQQGKIMNNSGYQSKQSAQQKRIKIMNKSQTRDLSSKKSHQSSFYNSNQKILIKKYKNNAISNNKIKSNIKNIFQKKAQKNLSFFGKVLHSRPQKTVIRKKQKSPTHVYRPKKKQASTGNQNFLFQYGLSKKQEIAKAAKLAKAAKVGKKKDFKDSYFQVRKKMEDKKMKIKVKYKKKQPSQQSSILKLISSQNFLQRTYNNGGFFKPVGKKKTKKIISQ